MTLISRCEPKYRKPCKCTIKCVCPLLFLWWCSNERYECNCPLFCHADGGGEKELLADGPDEVRDYQSVGKDDEISKGKL